MKALLIANGEIRDAGFYKEFIHKSNFSFIICADGGANNACKIGVIPDLVIGDLDSISEETSRYYEEIEVRLLKYPVEKDETDTELALNYLLEAGYDDITLIGCTGRRIDHTLANIHLLYDLLNMPVKAEIVDEYNSIMMIDKPMKINSRKGYTVSLIPVTEIVEGITLEGFFYKLENEDLIMGATRGVSNVILEDAASINFRRGKLLVVFSKGN